MTPLLGIQEERINSAQLEAGNGGGEKPFGKVTDCSRRPLDNNGYGSHYVAPADAGGSGRVGRQEGSGMAEVGEEGARSRDDGDLGG